MTSFTVDTLAGEVGSSILPALLVVDDDKVISSAAELRQYQVTAEILGAVAGPQNQHHPVPETDRVRRHLDTGRSTPR